MKPTSNFTAFVQPPRAAVWVSHPVDLAQVCTVFTAGALAVAGLRLCGDSATFSRPESGAGDFVPPARLKLNLEAIRDEELRLSSGQMWAGSVDVAVGLPSEYSPHSPVDIVVFGPGTPYEMDYLVELRIARRLGDLVCAGLRELLLAEGPDWTASVRAEEALRRAGLPFSMARKAAEEGTPSWHYQRPRYGNPDASIATVPGRLMWVENGDVSFRDIYGDDVALGPWRDADLGTDANNLDWVATEEGRERPNEALIAEVLWSLIRRPQSTNASSSRGPDEAPGLSVRPNCLSATFLKTTLR